MMCFPRLLLFFFFYVFYLFKKILFFCSKCYTNLNVLVWNKKNYGTATIVDSNQLHHLHPPFSMRWRRRTWWWWWWWRNRQNQLNPPPPLSFASSWAFFFYNIHIWSIIKSIVILFFIFGIFRQTSITLFSPMLKPNKNINKSSNTHTHKRKHSSNEMACDIKNTTLYHIASSLLRLRAKIGHRTPRSALTHTHIDRQVP